MASRAKSEAKTADPRGKIVDALMELAGEQRFEDIAIRDICKTAGVSLADFRDAFPSKGAVLAGLSRRIDRAVLSENSEELADENPRERLFDVLMRRLEAMAPYREGLREVVAWLRRDPTAALAMNQATMNSMRFMLEAAGIESDGGAAGVVKLQGLALAWARIVHVWLDDDDQGLSKTMAELDRELTRGERAVAGVDRLNELASPFRALAAAAFDARKRIRQRARRPQPNKEAGANGEERVGRFCRSDLTSPTRRARRRGPSARHQFKIELSCLSLRSPRGEKKTEYQAVKPGLTTLVRGFGQRARAISPLWSVHAGEPVVPTSSIASGRVRIEASDPRSDNHRRIVDIAREAVTIRRAVAGVAMSIRVAASDFRGVALRVTELDQGGFSLRGEIAAPRSRSFGRARRGRRPNGGGERVAGLGILPASACPSRQARGTGRRDQHRRLRCRAPHPA